MRTDSTTLALLLLLVLVGLTACGGSGDGSSTHSRRAAFNGDVELCVDGIQSLSYSVTFNKNEAGNGTGPFPLTGQDEFVCAQAPATQGAPNDDLTLGKAALIATVTDSTGSPVVQISAWNPVITAPAVAVYDLTRQKGGDRGQDHSFDETKSHTFRWDGRTYEVVAVRDRDGAGDLKQFLTTVRPAQ